MAEPIAGCSISRITSANGSAVVPIIDSSVIKSGITTPTGYQLATFAMEITNVHCSYSLPSFGACPSPNIAPEDTVAEQDLEVVRLQNTYPKVGLIVSLDSGSGWVQKSEEILQNYRRQSHLPLLYPYLVDQPQKTFEIGGNQKIGLNIKSYSNGALSTGDFVSCVVNWRVFVSYLLLPANDIKPGLDALATALTAINTTIKEPINIFNHQTTP